jgi:hypothetical protein
MTTAQRSARRSLAAMALALLIAACQTPDQVVGPVPEEPLPQVQILRINLDYNGNRNCVEDAAPTIIEIVDDMKNNRLVVTQRTEPPSLLGPKIDHYSSTALERLEIALCGGQNSLDYRLAVSNRNLTLPREFRILGSFGFDSVRLNFATNASGHHVTIEARVAVEMALYAGQDEVQIDAHTFAGDDFSVAADLGPGGDSFTLVTWPNPILGSVAVKVEGKEGDDTLFFDLTDNASAFHVPVGGSLTIEASGDTLDQFFLGNDNVADHGSDQVIAAFRGTVDGTLRIALFGDDTIARVKDLQCAHASQPCLFYCQCTLPVCTVPLHPFDPPVCDAPNGLERLLRDNPAYANDTVKLQATILAGSTGILHVSADGGLASDTVVLVVDNAGSEPADGWATLTGGQPHPFKTDACFASPGVTVQHCDATLPDPGDFN